MGGAARRGVGAAVWRSQGVEAGLACSGVGASVMVVNEPGGGGEHAAAADAFGPRRLGSGVAVPCPWRSRWRQGEVVASLPDNSDEALYGDAAAWVPERFWQDLLTGCSGTAMSSVASWRVGRARLSSGSEAEGGRTCGA